MLQREIITGDWRSRCRATNLRRIGGVARSIERIYAITIGGAVWQVGVRIGTLRYRLRLRWLKRLQWYPIYARHEIRPRLASCRLIVEVKLAASAASFSGSRSVPLCPSLSNRSPIILNRSPVKQGSCHGRKIYRVYFGVISG
jgi:hypothetical protein